MEYNLDHCSLTGRWFKCLAELTYSTIHDTFAVNYGDFVVRTRVGGNPLSVLGGISLSSLPESLAELIDSCLALLPAGQPFHSLPGTSRIDPSPSTLARMPFLFWSQQSLVAPHSAAVPRGERSFLRSVPRDPPTDSRPSLWNNIRLLGFFLMLSQKQLAS
jgi:hypothetical protein